MRLFSAVPAFCLAAAFCAQGAVVIEPKKDAVASGQETVAASEVGTEYMVPVTAGDLEEGTYEITVDSSSSMFKIVGCELSVSGGEMTAAVTLSGTAYTWLFAGTAEEAAAAGEEDYIPFEDVDGKYVYSFPVHALNEETPCAAFSKNKEKWYDRTLVFRADTIPEEKLSGAVKEQMAEAESKAAANAAAGANTAAGDSAGPGAEIVPATRAAEVHADLSEPSRRLDISDGDYTAEVMLEGGSGKASIAAPARVRVKDGQAEAAIEWSSPNYDYMIVNGEKYLSVNDSGNSRFEIPVAVIGEEIPVIGDTTAMSAPHEVEYTLTFTNLQPVKAEKKGFPAAAVIGCIAAAAGGWLVLRKKKN